MNGCFVRVLGDNFDPSKVLARVEMLPCAQFRLGEIREGRIRPSRTGGLTFEVGNGSLDQQIEFAIAFLSRYRDDLTYLSTITTIESFFLELTIECRVDNSTIVVQRDFLPTDLLRLAGEVGLGICISTAKTWEGKEAE